MSDKNQIKLKETSIRQIPLNLYQNDFTFIVNGKEFPTSRIIADLLSPNICKLHTSDPTINHFIINTKESGDFSNILNLINFNVNEIEDKELPFILSVLEILNIDLIEVQNADKNEELTINNVIKIIQSHEKHPIFYSQSLHKEIEFISSHFYEINEELEKDLHNLQNLTIEKIIANDHIQLKSEDQLLKVINGLYSENSSNSYLYSYVDFLNVSTSCMTEFIQIFDINDMLHETWKSITIRLQQEIKQPNESSSSNRIHKSNETCDVEEKRNRTTISFNRNNQLDGIINNLKNQSNGNITNIINITASMEKDQSSHPLTNLYENGDKYTYTENSPNSWICIDFINRRIIPTHYTVGTSHDANNHLKSWVIEGSSDGNSWDKLDEQSNCSVMNGQRIVHTFPINTQNGKEYRFIRIRQTDKNWGNNNYLDLSAFEFHGTLIN